MIGLKATLSVLIGLSTIGGCAGRAASPGERPSTRRLAPRFCRDLGGTAAADRCLGWFSEQLLLSSSDVLEDEPLRRYVEAVGHKVADQAQRPELSWTFHVLDEPAPRAYSSPGGYVYVTRGALALLDSEAELAALLGHEVAHVVAGHRAITEEGLPAFELPGLGALGSTFDYERDDERQADQLGLALLASAGYDPRAAMIMLGAIHQGPLERPILEPALDDEALLGASDYPALEARLALLSLRARDLPRGERGREPFLRAIDGLALGHNPERWRFEGRRVLFPRAGFSLELPEGAGQSLSLQLPSAAHLVIRGPDGERRLVLWRVGSRRSQIVRQMLLNDLERGPVREVDLEGVSARLGVLGGSWVSPERGAPVRPQPIALIEGDDGTTWALIAPDEDQRLHLTRALSTVRRVSPSDQGAAPHRLRVVEVERAVTFETWARQTCGATEQEPLARLETLNRSQPGDPLEPGLMLRCVLPP